MGVITLTDNFDASEKMRGAGVNFERIRRIR